MKINPGSMLNDIRQTVESEATKVTEAVQDAAQTVSDKAGDAKSAATDAAQGGQQEAKSMLGVLGNATRSKMDQLFDKNPPKAPNFMPKEGSLIGDVLLGASEGSKAGQASASRRPMIRIPMVLTSLPEWRAEWLAEFPERSMDSTGTRITPALMRSKVKHARTAITREVLRVNEP